MTVPVPTQAELDEAARSVRARARRAPLQQPRSWRRAFALALLAGVLLGLAGTAVLFSLTDDVAPAAWSVP